MKKGVILCLLLILTVIPFASAQITLNTFSSLYNLGDSLTVEPTLLEDSSFNGMVEITINCPGSTFMLFTSPVEITAGKESRIDVPNLKFAEDQGILGICSVLVSLKDSAARIIDEKSSDNFKISNNLTVSVVTNKEEYEPGKKVTISGRVIRENGQNADGSASVNLDITVITDVNAGFYMTDINLDKAAVSGEHEVTVNVEDKYHNKGTVTKKIKVVPIPSKIDLFMNKESFMPQDRIEASIKLYDQTNAQIDATGIITIYDPDYLEMISKQVNTDEKLEFLLPKTSKPGNWEIIAFSSGINLRKFVEIQTVSNISMNIDNNKLIVINEGNVPYKDTLKFSFEKDGQEQILEKDIDIEVGGSVSIPLSGEGNYNIKIDSKDNNAVFLSVSLTGGAIGVGEKIPISYIAVGIFVLGILVLGTVSMLRRKKENQQIDVKKMNMKQSDIDKIEQE
jgi:hypothetical protein